MWQRITELPIMAYLAITGFIQDFKKDEKGLEVVQVVLIVLIGVVLVGILMYLLRDWLADLWEQIVGTDLHTGGTTF